MCDYLVFFSTWAENNSGQIQILIAIVALVYARKAYVKVLEQIDISNKQSNKVIEQEVIANNQRIFELRLKVITLLLDSGSNCKLTRTKFKDVIAEYNIFLTENEQSEAMLNVHEQLKNLLESIKKQEESVKNIEDKLKNLLKDIIGIEDIDLSKLERVLITSTTLRGQIDKLLHSPDSYLISLKKIKRHF